MNAKEIIVYGLNVAVALAAFGLVYAGKIGYLEAVAFVTLVLSGALLVPSAAHVAAQRMLTKDKP